MCWCLHLRQRTGPELDPKILYLESADCMVQYTLQTDLIPGVGPSSDQLYPYEVRPAHRSTEADCHGLWREEKGGRNQIWDLSLLAVGPSTPGTGFRGPGSSWRGRRATGRGRARAGRPVPLAWTRVKALRSYGGFRGVNRPTTTPSTAT